MPMSARCLSGCSVWTRRVGGVRTTILETARLRLTTWDPSDLADLAQLHNDPDVMTHLGDGSPEPHAKVQVRLDGYLQEQNGRGWTKWRIENAVGTMIGRAGFSPFAKGRELGYTLARSCWGQGFATELAQALVDWDEAHPLTSLRPLNAFAVTDNVASRRVLEKVGFTFVDERNHGGRPHAFYELRR